MKNVRTQLLLAVLTTGIAAGSVDCDILEPSGEDDAAFHVQAVNLSTKGIQVFSNGFLAGGLSGLDDHVLAAGESRLYLQTFTGKKDQVFQFTFSTYSAERGNGASFNVPCKLTNPDALLLYPRQVKFDPDHDPPIGHCSNW